MPELGPLLARYDHVLLDLDGCVWLGGEPIPGAQQAVAALRRAGKHLAFLTNDPARSTEAYVRKLWELGFQASLAEVVTVGGALQFALAEGFAGASAFVIGSPAIHAHVAAAGLRVLNGTDLAPRADVVVIAGHRGFDHAELTAATQAGLRGAALIAAGRDPIYPHADGPQPGTGAIVAAVEYATGATAQSVGKPEPPLFETALDRLGPGRALMIGDRLDGDVAGAVNAGIDGAVVLTGVTGRAEAEAALEAEQGPRPVAVLESLAEVAAALEPGA